MSKYLLVAAKNVFPVCFIS